jgi:hypothetical protein
MRTLIMPELYRVRIWRCPNCAALYPRRGRSVARARNHMRGLWWPASRTRRNIPLPMSLSSYGSGCKDTIVPGAVAQHAPLGANRSAAVSQNERCAAFLLVLAVFASFITESTASHRLLGSCPFAPLQHAQDTLCHLSRSSPFRKSAVHKRIIWARLKLFAGLPAAPPRSGAFADVGAARKGLSTRIRKSRSADIPERPPPPTTRHSVRPKSLTQGGNRLPLKFSRMTR